MASSLVQISSRNLSSLDLQLRLESQVLRELPILVLFPHNKCNCRCLMCDIWRIREVRRIETADLLPHLESFRSLGTRWIVLSGGEALLHHDLRGFMELLHAEGMRITLLSTGLLLADNAALIAELVDDVIVSLDGPREIHNKIRRVRDAFEQMASGIQALRSLRSNMPISARSTVQKSNFRDLPRTVDAAHELGLNSISFLAVDSTSTAFNREDGWKDDQQARVTLSPEEVSELESCLNRMSIDYAEDFHSGFIQETPEKMRRIARHFRSALGEFDPVAPRCNAPWVSAVVESDGTVRPCFFHPPIGNFYEQPLVDILNSNTALEFRASLDIEQNAVCRKCVCSLYYSKPADELGAD
jgi:MoaA/NifB/PqqE/SkfB family radical SAM enzyme